MWKENNNGILLSGIPVKRKAAHTVHIEHDDDFACVDFDVRSGKIDRLHTPGDPFRRVHEMMHSRHTDPEVQSKDYEGIREIVWQITEDCRIHVDHWPWKYGNTPKLIKDDALKFLRRERADMQKILDKDPKKKGTWPDFAVRLRQTAVRIGLGTSRKTALDKAGFTDTNQRTFAKRIIHHLRLGNHRQAALEIEAAFFEPPPMIEGDNNTRSGKKRPGRNGEYKQPKMDIIELKLTEIIPEAKRGYRRASSGSRLHRPSIRKPVLPQKLFIRRTPREVAGTILVDASGSMGDFSQVSDWCKKAPFGTIAYYAGNSRGGTLYIYAKNGKRAAQIVDPSLGGNTVDGPAMDWLMTQPKPRLFITDRGFCGAADSEAQIMRLANLERRGEITVKDYAHGDDE